MRVNVLVNGPVIRFRRGSGCEAFWRHEDHLKFGKREERQY